jgi:hypothetical protein
MSAPVDEAVGSRTRGAAGRVRVRGGRFCRTPDPSLPDVNVRTCAAAPAARPAVSGAGPHTAPGTRSPHGTPAATAPPAATRPGPAVRLFRALRPHLGTLAGTAIVAVLFWRLGTGVFMDGLRRIDGGTVLVALVIGALTTVLSAWRWCLVARGLGIRLPLAPAVADYYRALFLNAALPGGILGDVHRAVRHGQSSGDMGRGVRAVVLERTAGQVVLAAVALTVLLIQPSPVAGPVRQAAEVAGLAALGGLAIVAAIRMGRGSGTPRRGRALRAMLTEARGVLFSRTGGTGVVVSSVLVLAGYVAMFLVAARVAGTGASAGELVPLALLALLAMGLPLNVGGWGPREGVTAWSFGAAGLGATQGLTVAVVYGVLSLVAALPGAVVLVARWYASLGAPRPAQDAEPESPAADGESEETTEKYAPKASASAVSNSLPFPAEASEGRPMTPESV